MTKLLRSLHNGEDATYILTIEELDEEFTSALIAQETLLGHYGSKRLVAQYWIKKIFIADNSGHIMHTEVWNGYQHSDSILYIESIF